MPLVISRASIRLTIRASAISAEIDRQLDAATQDCTITYPRGGKKLAVAVVNRDLAGLRAEVELETTTRGKPA